MATAPLLLEQSQVLQPTVTLCCLDIFILHQEKMQNKSSPQRSPAWPSKGREGVQRRRQGRWCQVWEIALRTDLPSCALRSCRAGPRHPTPSPSLQPLQGWDSQSRSSVARGLPAPLFYRQLREKCPLHPHTPAVHPGSSCCLSSRIPREHVHSELPLLLATMCLPWLRAPWCLSLIPCLAPKGHSWNICWSEKRLVPTLLLGRALSKRYTHGWGYRLFSGTPKQGHLLSQKLLPTVSDPSTQQCSFFSSLLNTLALFSGCAVSFKCHRPRWTSSFHNVHSS